jgi:GntR family transcriptional regulator
MLFKLRSIAGQPLYLQLMQQIRHAVEKGILQDGDPLPSIRSLAQELVISPTTVAKAYSELEHEGLLDLRQGLGAFISANRSPIKRVQRFQEASRHVLEVIESLRSDGLSDEEIRRIFESQLLQSSEALKEQ